MLMGSNKKKRKRKHFFLEKTHLSEASEDTFNKWRDEFKGEVLFPHGNTSSCGVMIGFLRHKNFECKKISNDTNDGITIMEAHTDDKLLVLDNSIAEVKQIKTLCDLDQLLGEFYYGS